MPAGRLVLPPRRAGRPAPDAVVQRRVGMRNFPHLVDPRAEIVQQSVGGVDCLRVTPPTPRATMVYFHGGAFRIGAPARMAGFLSQFALLTGCAIVAPAYGLAPEAPFPAALHDGAAVIGALKDEAAAPGLVLAGDSAGAGLAASLAANLAAALEGWLQAAVLFSPWLDLTVSADTYVSHAGTDLLFSKASALEAAELYLQGADSRNPLASPLFADLEDMPPTLIFAGGAEVLLADSLSFASRLALAGVDVELHAVRDMQHIFPVLFPDLPETRDSLAAVAGFLDRRLGPREAAAAVS